MANFTHEIRRELLSSFPDGAARDAALYALFRTGGTPQGVEFTCEDERVAEYVLRLFEDVFGVRMGVKRAVFDPKKNRDKLTFSYSGGECGAMLRRLASFPRDDDACALWYLRGAFVGGGSCTLPHGGARTGYHLECVFSEEGDAEEFCTVLEHFQLLGSVVRRGERFVAYLKSREAIGDFLSVTGAGGALRILEHVSAEREESNNENRVSNCFAGNADRAAIASAAQAVAFREMEEGEKLSALPSSLRETARARMDNPTLSLSELAARLGVSKSCLNHRLRKLMKIHDEGRL